MSEEGYIPATLISTFNRMRNLSLDINLIIESCKLSDKLDIKDNLYVS